ncbi:MAG: efflux transporter, family, subunit [Cyanobacteria bacterium RYN_339]|nr:efflux transporter, family, subunit [Cyanobacteria bacterium RYN_339]
MANRSTLIVALVLFAAAAGGGYWYTQYKRTPEVTYTTVPAQRGHVEAKVTASGTLSALVTVQVGSQVSGRITSLGADFNGNVHKGQVLARLDPQLFQAALEQARANDLSARSNLVRSRAMAWNADQQLIRARQLWARQLIAKADLDTAQANADSARAQVLASQASVDQAKAQLNTAQVNLGYTTIVSPIDGIVISRSVDVGQTVAASLQAPTLFVLAQDLKKEQVDAAVAEADVGKLKPGMRADFTVAAFPADKFTGKVRQVRNAAVTTQNVVTYDAVIDVDNPELKLKPGMTANVTFTYAESDDALTVPNAALRFKPPQAVLDAAAAKRDAAASAAADPGASGDAAASGASGDAAATGDQAAAGKPWQGRQGRAGKTGVGAGGRNAPDRKQVWVLRDGKPVSVRVRTGITDGSTTAILGGRLNENDAVITESSGEPGKDKAAAGAKGGRAGGRRPGGIF